MSVKDWPTMTPQQIDALMGPGTYAKLQQQTWDSLVRDGRRCREFGKRIDECPPFTDENMAASWRMGWHQADEELKRRRGGR